MYISRITVFIVLLLGISESFAHVHLMKTSPSKGSLVHEPPAQVVALFNSTLEPLYSKIELFDAQGQSIASGGIDPDQGAQLLIKLTSPLSSGQYEVKWTAIAHDGHRQQGSYHFKVDTKSTS